MDQKQVEIISHQKQPKQAKLEETKQSQKIEKNIHIQDDDQDYG